MGTALYVTPEELKASLSIPDATTDADVDRALASASRAVETLTDRRRFDVDATPVLRTYTRISGHVVVIDDAAEITDVNTADFTAEPLNATADGEPFTRLVSTSGFPSGIGAVEVTATWGWPAIPNQVKQFVIIIASKLLKRTREAPWGVLTTGSIDGIAIRLAREDPDLQLLIGPLMRHHPAVA